MRDEGARSQATQRAVRVCVRVSGASPLAMKNVHSLILSPAGAQWRAQLLLVLGQALDDDGGHRLVDAEKGVSPVCRGRARAR